MKAERGKIKKQVLHIPLHCLPSQYLLKLMVMKSTTVLVNFVFPDRSRIILPSQTQVKAVQKREERT